jgi:hypothetical protein
MTSYHDRNGDPGTSENSRIFPKEMAPKAAFEIVDFSTESRILGKINIDRHWGS